MSKRWLIGGVLLLTVYGVGCRQPSHQAPSTSELEGSWEVTQIINNGEPAPANEIKGMRFIFAVDNLTMTAPDEGPDVMEFKLDPTQEPAALDLTDDQMTIRAIYKIDGDTLTIGLRPRTAMDRARPTTFEFEQGSVLSVMVLKRR